MSGSRKQADGRLEASMSVGAIVGSEAGVGRGIASPRDGMVRGAQTPGWLG